MIVHDAGVIENYKKGNGKGDDLLREKKNHALSRDKILE
jgi:hypothetical protein